MQNEQNKSPFGNAIVRTLAIFGFLAVVIVGMWGSVQIARGIPNAFSSLASAMVSFTSIFVPAGETISLSAASLSVESNKPITISWFHDKKSVEGSYVFRYNCVNDAYFASAVATGTPTTVYCNVPFNFINSSNSITITPISTSNRFIDVQVFIDFIPNGASQATVTGQTTFTIVNTGVTVSPGTIPTTPVPTTPTPTTPRPITQGPETRVTYPIGGARASDPNGYVDLSARVIEVGVVDKTTGVFTASSTPSRANTRIAVRFAVENLGTKTSPQFDFNAILPTQPSNIFSAPMQQALNPGDRIEFTVGFDSFNSANPDGVFIINVDPSNRINERNKDNNIVRYTINTRP
ncbi:hypothetical protein EPO56_01730 [Patescibacteria group bacterium]|nr:MAG: hypothetical protein EPO56_01730 [Patescibacteria group bacterium]